MWEYFHDSEKMVRAFYSDKSQRQRHLPSRGAWWFKLFKKRHEDEVDLESIDSDDGRSKGDEEPENKE